MESLGGQFPRKPGEAFGRILSRDLFFYLLDLEIKRARRYQNFLCLMLLKIKQYTQEGDGGGLEAFYKILGNLLTEEMRESDIIGSLELDKLVVLLPYADVKAGGYVQSRFEEALKFYDFKRKGFEVVIDQICFPMHGTDIMDLIKKALTQEAS